MCYRPMEDGEMIMRFMGEDGELVDLRTNAVCAGRFAIAVLDLINQNGWFDVDLRGSDRGLGDRWDQALCQDHVRPRISK